MTRLSETTKNAVRRWRIARRFGPKDLFGRVPSGQTEQQTVAAGMIRADQKLKTEMSDRIQRKDAKAHRAQSGPE